MADLHPITLAFKDPEVEARYFAARSLDAATYVPIRQLLYVTGALGWLESIAHMIAFGGGFSPFRLGIFGVYGVIVGFGALTHLKVVLIHGTKLALIGFAAVCCALIAVVGMAPPSGVIMLWPFFLVLQTYNSGLPYSHIAKILINLAAVVSTGLVASSCGLEREQVWSMVTQVLMSGVALSVLAFRDEELKRRNFELSEALAREKIRSETLLYHTIPEHVAQRLKTRDESDGILVDHCSEAVVLFADIVGFTPFARRTEPEEVVKVLNEVFSRLDQEIARHGMEKIKTIGDAVMAVAGVPKPEPEMVERVAAAALAMIASIEAFRRESGVELRIRVGFHVGPAVAGVIGRSRFLYDLWGDTVNIAARLEGSSEPDRVQVTTEVGERLAGRFEVATRGKIELKGLGLMETSYVVGPSSRALTNFGKEAA